MTHFLKNRHRFIWIAIALIVPVLMVFAILEIPTFPLSEAVKNTATTPMGKVIKQSKNDLAEVNLRGTSNKVEQLEIVLHKPLKAASAVIYDDQGNVIGQLEGQGVYRFSLERSITSVLIKDNVKNEELTQLFF